MENMMLCLWGVSITTEGCCEPREHRIDGDVHREREDTSSHVWMDEKLTSKRDDVFLLKDGQTNQMSLQH